MAGPLSGVGSGQQQIALATPFQPGQGPGAIRRDENQQARDNRIQPQGSEAGQAQASNAQNQNSKNGSEQSLISNLKQVSGEQNTSAKRGSVLDITV